MDNTNIFEIEDLAKAGWRVRSVNNYCCDPGVVNVNLESPTGGEFKDKWTVDMARNIMACLPWDFPKEAK